MSLETMARRGLWPTPTVKGNYANADRGTKEGDGLATAVARTMWPTPVASMATGRGPTHQAQDPRRGERLIDAVAKTDIGPLNPRWVEWLMGFPIDWTASWRSETPLFPNALKQ